VDYCQLRNIIFESVALKANFLYDMLTICIIECNKIVTGTASLDRGELQGKLFLRFKEDQKPYLEIFNKHFAIF
jgi:hypothetical protein